MAQRSKTKFSSIVESDEKLDKEVEEILNKMQPDLYGTLDIDPVPLYTKVEQSTKKLQSCFAAHLKLTGRASGKLYEWAKAGDVVDVLVEDVEELLQKRIGDTSCCGNSQRGNLLLKLVV